MWVKQYGQIPDTWIMKEAANTIARKMIAEGRISNFRPPFRVMGNWINDSRGRGVCEMGESREALKDIADALNAWAQQGIDEAANAAQQAAIAIAKKKDKTVDEAMWPFKKKKAPEISAPKRWPDRDDDLEQWMRDKIAHYKSKGWDPAVFFSPATGDYFPIYFATGFRYNDAAKQAYRNIKREFPDLVKRAKEEISTPMAMRINQSRVGDHEDWPENSPSVYENFADGKGPGRPGDSARHGIPKHATMSELEKASHAKGRKGQLARWQINMRNGKNK
jgi:hypothetical protein